VVQTGCPGAAAAASPWHLLCASSVSPPSVIPVGLGFRGGGRLTVEPWTAGAEKAQVGREKLVAVTTPSLPARKTPLEELLGRSWRVLSLAPFAPPSPHLPASVVCVDITWKGCGLSSDVDGQRGQRARTEGLTLSAPVDATETVAGPQFAFSVKIPAAGDWKGDWTFQFPPAAAIPGVHPVNATATAPNHHRPPARVRKLPPPQREDGGRSAVIAHHRHSVDLEARRSSPPATAE
jgi:hypothetical protein